MQSDPTPQGRRSRRANYKGHGQVRVHQPVPRRYQPYPSSSPSILRPRWKASYFPPPSCPPYPPITAASSALPRAIPSPPPRPRAPCPFQADLKRMDEVLHGMAAMWTPPEAEFQAPEITKEHPAIGAPSQPAPSDEGEVLNNA